MNGKDGKDECWVGIDVAKAKLDVDAVKGSGKPRRKRVSNTKEGYAELAAWLAANGFAGAKVCLEATGRYGEKVAEALHDAGFIVSVANPGQVKPFIGSLGSRNKTDEADAAGIREFCRRMEPKPWTPPSKKTRLLRDLMVLRDAHVADATAWSNRIEGGLDPDADRLAKERLAEIRGHVETLEARIAEEIGGDDDLDGKRRLLESIPGIGDATIRVLLTELPADIPRRAKESAAYAGLNPARKESGTMVGKTSLSKRGRARLRTAMYMAALSSIRNNPIIKAFAERLRSRDVKGKRLVCACARKLLTICCAVLRTKKAFDPDFRPAAA